jgi:predicted nicotinamide N-methyase
MHGETQGRIGAFTARLTQVPLDDGAIALWTVADLERHVDRAALLAAEDPPEPPYWAHLWSGALALADVVPRDAGTVLELGCGLGLPGLVAARRGGRVTFVDRIPVALEFVRASVRANGGGPVGLVAADFTAPPLRRRFDLVLAAEVLYDRGVFGRLARTLADVIAPGGRGMLADAGRIDTRAFYPELEAVGLRAQVVEREMREEGMAVRVRLVDLRPDAVGSGRGRR